MTNNNGKVANAAIIPTRKSSLYESPGVDLIVTEAETDGWQPVEWLPAHEDADWGWDWRAQLLDAGWLAFEGDAEHVTDDHLVVPVTRRTT